MSSWSSNIWKDDPPSAWTNFHGGADWHVVQPQVGGGGWMTQSENTNPIADFLEDFDITSLEDWGKLLEIFFQPGLVTILDAMDTLGVITITQRTSVNLKKPIANLMDWLWGGFAVDEETDPELPGGGSIIYLAYAALQIIHDLIPVWEIPTGFNIFGNLFEDPTPVIGTDWDGQPVTLLGALINMICVIGLLLLIWRFLPMVPLGKLATIALLGWNTFNNYRKGMQINRIEDNTKELMASQITRQTVKEAVLDAFGYLPTKGHWY